MSRFREIVEKCVNQPDRVTPDECRRILEELGYEAKKKPGSEVVYHKKGARPINVPTPKNSRYVKSPYINRIVSLLELEEYLDE